MYPNNPNQHPKMISLTVRNVVNNRLHQITANRETLIQILKQEVARIWGIPHDLQLFVYNGKLIHNESDLSRYGVKDSDFIDFRVKFPHHAHINITVEHHYEPSLVVVAETQWPITHLMDLIDMHIGVPRHRQLLEYMGSLMEECHKLMDYVIDIRPIVRLTELPRLLGPIFEIRIVNMDSGKVEEMTVDELDTMYTVAAEMRRRGLNQGRDFCFVHIAEELFMGATLLSVGIHESTVLKMYCSPQAKL